MNRQWLEKCAGLPAALRQDIRLARNVYAGTGNKIQAGQHMVNRVGGSTPDFAEEYARRLAAHVSGRRAAAALATGDSTLAEVHKVFGQEYKLRNGLSPWGSGTAEELRDSAKWTPHSKELAAEAQTLAARRRDS